MDIWGILYWAKIPLKSLRKFYSVVNSQKKREKKKNQELQTSERVDLEHFKVYKCVAVLRDHIPCDHFLGCQYFNFSDTGEKQNKQKSQSSDRLGCLKYIFIYFGGWW